MTSFPPALTRKLNLREEQLALRQLTFPNDLIDFSSNDYLGFSKSSSIFNQTHDFLLEHHFNRNGATGSRLLSGNHHVYSFAEEFIANFHESESALLFNSGYDANLGFFSAVPQRGDVVLYDELCHASIRDGIQLGLAKSYKFLHNDLEDLERLLQKFTATSEATIYVVTESVFSMDGDAPHLADYVRLTALYASYLVVDEAHALGVFGDNGEGLVQQLGLHKQVFARIMTFGKGLGCHGAAILGSVLLQSYLVNFARSFIYTTGLSPHSVATIFIAYQHLVAQKETRKALRDSIVYFNQQKKLLGLQPLFVRSQSAIQCAIIPGNEKVKNIALHLREKGFDVKPILAPTVPEGQERLRFCLHSYNTTNEIDRVLHLLHHLVFE